MLATPEACTRFGSTRSQVRILSPRSVTPRVLGDAGNPFFSLARESAREQVAEARRSSPACLVEDRPESGPSDLSWGQHPPFSCISCRPSPLRGCGETSDAAGLRSAAAALRSGAGVGVEAVLLSRDCGAGAAPDLGCLVGVLEAGRAARAAARPVIKNDRARLRCRT
jgi:hypothetical protein